MDIAFRHIALRAKSPAIGLVAALLVASCHGSGPLEVTRASSAQSSIEVGQQIDFWMGTVGPGSYLVPPALSGSALTFLGETSGGEPPSGSQQIFHFLGVAGGRTIIMFQNTNPDKTRYPDVSDTVVVR
jgi:hypothetical protein